jgi:trehalose 6-phosphate phosphatase
MTMTPLPDALLPLVRDADSAALFVDFDGTLAPIVADPDRARPLPEARAALQRLAVLVARVAVVSARPAAFLADALDVEGVELAGVYGLERVVAGEVVVDPRVEPWLDLVARAADAADAELPGLLVERKGRVAVTVHWRNDPAREAEALAWAKALAARTGLSGVRGRKAIELRPPVPVDKGSTAMSLLSDTTAVAFAGDDEGDVAAFAALAELARAGVVGSAVSIGVDSDEALPDVRQADVVVPGPAGLAALLDVLADAIEAHKRSTATSNT